MKGLFTLIGIIVSFYFLLVMNVAKYGGIVHISFYDAMLNEGLGDDAKYFALFITFIITLTFYAVGSGLTKKEN